MIRYQNISCRYLICVLSSIWVSWWCYAWFLTWNIIVLGFPLNLCCLRTFSWLLVSLYHSVKWSKVIRKTQKWSDPVSNSKVVDLTKYCAVVSLKPEVTVTTLANFVPSFVGELQRNENFAVWHFFFKKVSCLGRCGYKNVWVLRKRKYQPVKV